MSTTLKISASTLDNFRTCSLGKFGKNMDDFIRKLDEPWLKTEAQSKGEAYHKLLEFGPLDYKESDPNGGYRYRVNDPEMNIDWLFTEDQAAPALATHTNHPNIQHEVWGSLNFNIGDYNIRINLRVDGLEKFKVWDYKTTSSKYTPKVQDYYDSVQWPLYMKAYPDATEFQYRIFHFVGLKCDQHDFVFPREVVRENYAMGWLNKLIDFAEQKEIIEKFIHLTPANNDSVRNRNSTQGDD